MADGNKTESNDRSVSTLFVRKLPTDARSSDLEAFFSEVGPIRNCFVVADTSNGKLKESDPNFRNKGYGYVHYAVAEDAREALKTLKDVKFKGQTTLHLELALRKSVAQKRQRPESAPAAKAKKQKTDQQQFNKHARVIVRNLPWKYTEKKLKKLFGKHGEIKEIQLPRKYPGGPLRGFAFIQFDKVSEAQAAMDALNATEHEGRLIAVDWSLAKDRFEELERQEAIKDQAEENEERSEETKENEQEAADSDEEMAEANDEESQQEDESSEEDDESDADEDEAKEVEGDEESEADEAKVSSEESNDESEEASSGDESEQDGSDEEFAAASEDVEMDAEFSETEEEDEDEDDSDEENESGSDEEEEGETENTKQQDEKPKKKLPSASEGTTLFVRNLLFESTEQDLKQLFKQWGPVLYAKITRNRETNQSRGTAFVCMRKKEDADRCIKEADTLRRMQAEEDDEDNTSKALMSNREKKKKGLNYDSILTPDAGLGLGVKFTLDGRVLDVTRAVERKDAEKIKDEKQALKKKEDKRNIYLMYEGVVFPNTPAAETMSPRELSKRQMSFSMRKRLLNQDPILFISKTRLSIRNIPTHVDDATLKKLGYQSIEKFKEQVKKNQRTDLSKEEKAEGWQYKPRVKQAKIVRSKDRVDASGKLRSKGYGFLEYTTHAHALAALRYLNNNPEVFGKKRLIVEFSIENKQVIENRSKRMQNNKVQNSPQKNGRKEAAAAPKKVPKTSSKAVAKKKNNSNKKKKKQQQKK